MRSGELQGLQWQDIDFKGKFVMVRRQRVLGKVQSTKTSSTRRIDLSSPLADALKKLKLRRKEQWLAKGQTEIPPWVFDSRPGHSPKRPSNGAFRLIGLPWVILFRSLEMGGLCPNCPRGTHSSSLEPATAASSPR